MPLSRFIFSGGRLILSLYSQNIKVFKMPLFEFIFGGGRLILSLLPQRYSSFQNASLKIYIWRWLFNLISFASKCLSILP